MKQEEKPDLGSVRKSLEAMSRPRSPEGMDFARLARFTIILLDRISDLESRVTYLEDKLNEHERIQECDLKRLSGGNYDLP